MTAQAEAAGPVTAEMYAEINAFYARHMRHLDDGRTDAWAAGFAEDGVFAQNVAPEPCRGRTAIAELGRTAMAGLAERGLVRRHWFGMVDAEQRADGTVHTMYYALVFETPRGGKGVFHLSCTGADILVRHDGEWLVQDRLVVHDATD